MIEARLILVTNLKKVQFFFISFLCFTAPILNAAFAQGNEDNLKKINPYANPKLVKLPNADAKNAIEIEDSIVGPLNVSLGYGLKNELKQLTSSLYHEDNSAWFKFTVNYDTVLTFDIAPFDSLDDYDFVLFKCTDTSCIDNNEKFKPIRACFSICISKSGMTGLSEYTTGNVIRSGPGPAYASSVRVKAGETYYLMINYGQEYMNERRHPIGFMIYFYNYCPKKKPIVLNNIFFEIGNAVLQKESFPELDRLVKLLSKSQMVIEVRGHTDNEGDKKKNQQLSEDRAKAVVDHLISKGINKNRLFYKGFGSSKPIASNNTGEGRQKNRRVEFVKVMY